MRRRARVNEDHRKKRAEDLPDRGAACPLPRGHLGIAQHLWSTDTYTTRTACIIPSPKILLKPRRLGADFWNMFEAKRM